MEIKKIEKLKDGGSYKIYCNDDIIYVFDYRLRTKTKGRLYSDYPNSENSNIIYDDSNLERELIIAIKEYNKNNLDNLFHDIEINKFILDKESEFSDRNKTLIRFGSIVFEYNEKEELEITSSINYDGNNEKITNILERDDVISLINYLNNQLKNMV